MSKGSESNRLAKECIVTALVELMKIRDYDAITITDIAKKAGVSRMAYYRNYTSKDDILNKYMDEVGISIHKRIVEGNRKTVPYDYFYALFEQLGKYCDIGIAAYHAHLGELILTNISKNMFESFPPKGDSLMEKYSRFFIAGAFYNVLIEWLKNGAKEDCSTMANICAQLVSHDAPNPFEES